MWFKIGQRENRELTEKEVEELQKKQWMERQDQKPDTR